MCLKQVDQASPGLSRLSSRQLPIVLRTKYEFTGLVNQASPGLRRPPVL
jgi:hypothetical protein